VAMLVPALMLGMVMGFAAHRASVCTVRAVAEVMSARSAYMFAGVGRSWLWIWAVTFPFLWLVPAAGGVNGWALTGLALLGGLTFGFGAAVNGACAFSTMSRLMDGEGAMFVAIAGFAAGAGLFAVLLDAQWLSPPMPAPALIGAITAWSLLPAIGFGAFAIYEAIRLWRTRDRGARLRDLVLAKRYRLSTAAMLMGLTGVALFLLYGAFGYTSTFELLIERALGTAAMPPSTMRWVLLFAVLAGMLVSALLRGSFRLDLRPRPGWVLNFIGGALMGFGTALAPGGNDALVMYGVPTLSPYALPTYVALAAGVAAGLLLLRVVAGFRASVEFKNDVFIADSWTRPLPGDPMPAAGR
jgi:uncharacterized membrane protein YedE/YeeE